MHCKVLLSGKLSFYKEMLDMTKRDKHSSLSCQSVTDDENRFSNRRCLQFVDVEVVAEKDGQNLQNPEKGCQVAGWG